MTNCNLDLSDFLLIQRTLITQSVSNQSWNISELGDLRTDIRDDPERSFLEVDTKVCLQTRAVLSALH